MTGTYTLPTFKCSAAGDDSYELKCSILDGHNWYIRHRITKTIIWNGSFDDASQAIKAAEVDGFEFDTMENF